MRRFFIAVLLATVFLYNLVSIGECREFVFVVNSGQSMNNSDPQNRVFESIAWGLSNLSDDDEASVISFNDQVSILRPLSKVSENRNKVFNFNYSGQSNAGDAMLTAVDMLMPKFDDEKNIIFITDGEISLTNPAETLRSVEKFHDGLKQAEWANMSVYIFNLRYQGNPLNYHSYADLAKEIPIPHTELMTAIRTVFHDNFHVPHLKLFSQPATSEKFSAEIPLTSFDKAKLFLIASNPGSSRLENNNAVELVDGKFVKVFELNSEQSKELEFGVNYPQGTGLTLDAVAEVEGDLQAEVSSSLFSADRLEITPTYKKSPKEKIFADKFFENKTVRVEVNGNLSHATVKDGVITLDMPGDVENISVQKVYFEDLGVNYIGKDFVDVKPGDGNYLLWILAFVAISVILVLSYFLRKKNVQQAESVEEKISVPEKPAPIKPKPETVVERIAEKIPEVKPVKEEKFSYEGKFLIYVTKTLHDEDIEPREFNLFRVGRKSINLLEILTECGIAENFQDVEGIVFSPARRGIVLQNDSDCTIIKRGVLLEKGNRTEIYFEDSINISTSDESAEMILRYKSLKPS